MSKIDPIKIQLKDLQNPLKIIDYTLRASQEIERHQKEAGLEIGLISNILEPSVLVPTLRAMGNYMLLASFYGTVIFGAYEGVKNLF